MEKNIRIQFPLRENDEYLDGRVHEVKPINLIRLNTNTSTNYYVLSYTDLTSNNVNGVTVISEQNGAFYKRPLDNYDNINDLLEGSREVDPSLLPSNIYLGLPMKISQLQDIVDIANTKPNTADHIYDGYNMYQSYQDSQESNRVIRIRFPYEEGNDYLDGTVHEITPIRLYRIPGTEYFILEFRDLSHGNTNSVTILNYVMGTFYKRPLDSYLTIPSLIPQCIPVNTDILPDYIYLGVPMAALDLSQLNENIIRENPYKDEQPLEYNNTLASDSSSAVGLNTSEKPYNEPDKFNFASERTITFGIAYKVNDNIAVDYYTADVEYDVTHKFEGEPSGNYIFYKNIKKLCSVIYPHGYQNELYSNYVEVGKTIGSGKDYIVCSALDDAEILEKRVIQADKILISKSIQFEQIEGETQKRNIISDSYFNLSDRTGVMVKNQFASEFIGFPNIVEGEFNPIEFFDSINKVNPDLQNHIR